MRNTKNLSADQPGFVSLVVALTMIIILALITVGFAQLARREQTQALDRQLAIQANYAAETGINDARQAIIAGALPAATPPNTCTRLETLTPPSNFSSSINATGDIRYTCLLIDQTPPTQEWTNVGAGADRTLTFATTTAPDRFIISWGSQDGHNTFPATTGGKFPPSWNYPALIQFSITPYADISRPALTANNYTAYLYPAQTSNSGAYSLGIAGTTNNGPILSGGCDPAGGPDRSATYPCSVTITGLGAAVGTGPYLVHFLNLYDTSNILVKYYDSGGAEGHFVNGQVVIDSTGKARDVLKRLRVHTQLPGSDGFIHSSGLELPNYAIQAQNICKRLKTKPIEDGTTFEDIPGAAHSACNLTDYSNPAAAPLVPPLAAPPGSGCFITILGSVLLPIGCPTGAVLGSICTFFSGGSFTCVDEGG